MKNSPVWIIKIGSSLLIKNNESLHESLIASYSAQIKQLHIHNVKVVLVSSGAVAMGRAKLRVRALTLQQLQVAAAVGQIGLMSAYEKIFSRQGLGTAQVLLTHNDMQQRKSYLNARAALGNLLTLGIVPIVNENDTVMVEEECFGDNDRLAALVANLLTAERLIILTDQQGLYNKDPRHDQQAELIKEVYAEDESLDRIASSRSGELGRGGMFGKINAARIAAYSGTHTIIANGRNERVLLEIHAGRIPGTLFRSQREPSVARKRWLASQRVNGRVHLDDGAVQALCTRGVSLLPVGMVRAEGNFERGDLISCVGADEREVARGLVNYGVKECERIAGKPSNDIAVVLGYEYESELIHRDNLVLL